MIVFGGVKPKLRELVKEWNRSFVPTEMLKENGIIEQWDYAALVNRLGSREDVDSHVMYLWEFANNNQILGSCMITIEGEPETCAEAEIISRTGAGEKTKDPVTKGPIQAIDDHEDEEESDESEEEVEPVEPPPQKATEAATAEPEVEEPEVEEPEVEEPEVEEPEVEEPEVEEPEVEEPEVIIELETEEPKTEKPFDAEHFTASQQLNFEHLKVYNGV
jgi:hypothetical protein